MSNPSLFKRWSQVHRLLSDRFRQVAVLHGTLGEPRRGSPSLGSQGLLVQHPEKLGAGLRGRSPFETSVSDTTCRQAQSFLAAGGEGLGRGMSEGQNGHGAPFDFRSGASDAPKPSEIQPRWGWTSVAENQTQSRNTQPSIR